MTGKLVRDRIPEIIRANGGQPVTRIAAEAEYRQLLRDKLAEETGEVHDADAGHAPGELADVLEVVRAIAADLGLGLDELERIRADKEAERGGFAGRVVWYPEPERESEAGS